MKPPDEHGTEFDSMIDSVREVMLAVARAAAWIQQAFETAEHFDPTQASFYRNAETLGRVGWTVPMWAPIGVATRMKDMASEDIDTVFVEAYASEDSKRYKSMIDELRGEPTLSHWRALIEECDFAYVNGKFRIVVPSLLTVVEGYLVALSQRTGRGAKPTMVVKDCFELGMGGSVLASVRGFVSEVYRNCDFAADRPAMMNRHWILHGRDNVDWTRADCLRLFQALQTLSYLKPIATA